MRLFQTILVPSMCKLKCHGNRPNKRGIRSNTYVMGKRILNIWKPHENYKVWRNYGILRESHSSPNSNFRKSYLKLLRSSLKSPSFWVNLYLKNQRCYNWELNFSQRHFPKRQRSKWQFPILKLPKCVFSQGTTSQILIVSKLQNFKLG